MDAHGARDELGVDVYVRPSHSYTITHLQV